MMRDIMLFAVLLICLYTDIRYKKIYNIITFPAVVAAIILNIYFNGLNGGLESIKGLFFGMALLFFPFVMGGLGAGDVKLLGVVGAFKGLEYVWLTFLAMAITGGVISLIIMIREKSLVSRLKIILLTLFSFFYRLPKTQYLETIESSTALTFPYGIAITAGAVIAYLLR
ncbi:MAG TPA: prepilin peptidase [Thermoanaerobacterales bacterium]|nr:prepilin peptidase [Thermoanaerobacterales bacterium]